MINGLSEAVSIFTNSNNLHYQLWGFYIAVAIGLLGFRFSDTYKKIPLFGRSVLVIGFVGFAMSNLNAILINIEQYNTILTALASRNSEANVLIGSGIFAEMPLRNAWIIGPFHIVMTVLVSLLLARSNMRSLEGRHPTASG